MQRLTQLKGEYERWQALDSQITTLIELQALADAEDKGYLIHGVFLSFGVFITMRQQKCENKKSRDSKKY